MFSSSNKFSIPSPSGLTSANRTQDHASRRIEYLQQLQASCDSIVAAAVKVQHAPISTHDLPKTTYAAVHARSKSFSYWPSSTSPTLSNLMQNHELAQSKLCGTARDVPPHSSSTNSSPGHTQEPSFASSPPQSPRTPLYPPTRHECPHSGNNNPVDHDHHHHSGYHTSPIPPHSQPHMHLPLEEFSHRLANTSSPVPAPSFDIFHQQHAGLDIPPANHYQQNHKQTPHHHHSLSPHTPHQLHQREDEVDYPHNSASIDLSPNTPVLSTGHQQVTAEPYTTHSDKDTLQHLRQGVIGNNATYMTPFGRKRLVYADWAASGRLLSFTESFLTTQVAPWYANVHTDVGACATHTSTLFEEARECVAACVRAPRCDYSVMFVGSGMTAAAFKLAHLLGLTEQTGSATGRPVVMYSIMEHHSNCLLWRELDVDTVVIQEDAKGLPDLNQLERALQQYSSTGVPLILGSFSAGSNVTGIAPDVQAIASLLHRYGAIAAFDYASAGSCKHIDCAGDGFGGSGRSTFSDLMEDDSLDAVMLSPHKLLGGPGSSGVLVVKRSIVRAKRPQSPGGGTVRYVNKSDHWFESEVERREEAGTPDVIGAIRCALALQLHAQLNQRIMHAMPVAHALRAVRAWQHAPTIQIVGSTRSAFWDEKSRLPLVSFNVVVPVKRRHERGGSSTEYGTVPQHRALHPQFVAALLNDLFGIQARAGCACAGPYGHQLLKESLLAVCGCSHKTSLHELDKLAASGNSWIKPGWVRVYFSYLMTANEVDYIITAVLQVAQHGHKLLPLYHLDTSTGVCYHYAGQPAICTEFSPCASHETSICTWPHDATDLVLETTQHQGKATTECTGTFRHRSSVLESSDVSKQLLRDTVQSWITGHSSTAMKTYDVSTSGRSQSASIGQHSSSHLHDARHAEEVLAQQLAEAQAVLSIEAGSAEVTRCTGRGTRQGRDIASENSDAAVGDTDCESCTARWFLLPHESETVCSLGSTELPTHNPCPTAAVTRSGRSQGMQNSDTLHQRGYSTGAFEERRRQQIPTEVRSSAFARHAAASDDSHRALTTHFAPSEDLVEGAYEREPGTKREEWSCSRREKSRRDCFCPRCCAERVCGGLASKCVRNKGHRNDQLAHSARVRYMDGHRSSCDSPPAPHRQSLRSESVPSSYRRLHASSAVLQNKIAATDRASAALTAGRAALAQSIRRRKQREAVSGHRCRHVR